MTTFTYHSYAKDRNDFPKLSSFASWPGAMINPQWLELPMSRTYFHGPKDVRAIETRLYKQRNVEVGNVVIYFFSLKKNYSQTCPIGHLY